MKTLTDGKLKVPSPRTYLMGILDKRVARKNTLPVCQGPWDKIKNGDIKYDIVEVEHDADDSWACDLVISCKAGVTVIEVEQLMYQFLRELGFVRDADDMYEGGGLGELSGWGGCDGGIQCRIRMEFETEKW